MQFSPDDVLHRAPLPVVLPAVGPATRGDTIKPLRTGGPSDGTDDMMETRVFDLLQLLQAAKCHPRSSFQPERFLAQKSSTARRFASSIVPSVGIVCPTALLPTEGRKSLEGRMDRRAQCPNVDGAGPWAFHTVPSRLRDDIHKPTAPSTQTFGLSQSFFN